MAKGQKPSILERLCNNSDNKDKSTVIDALDVYFNDASIEPSDLNVYADPSETGSIEISCSFEVDPDERITLDSSENTATTLKAEYLLNKENLLEISKKYECSNGRIKKPVSTLGGKLAL